MHREREIYNERDGIISQEMGTVQKGSEEEEKCSQ
jgi:hypothetical protein